MGTKRIVLGLVTLVMAALSLAAGLTATAHPNVYYDMLRSPGTTSATSQVYYDM